MNITTETLVNNTLVIQTLSALLNNPLALGQQSKPSAAFLVGGYFHTAILEPNKLRQV